MADDKKRKRKTEQPCTICTEQSKYTCPSCMRTTCSLNCCKEHKQKFDCNGKRPKSALTVKRSELTEDTLYKDFLFLEETCRFVGATNRGPAVKATKRKRFTHTKVRRLVAAAAERGIDVKVMPLGLQRAKDNTSMFVIKSNFIQWKIEWIFPKDDAKYIQEKAADTVSLMDHLQSFLSPSPDNTARRLRMKVSRLILTNRPEDLVILLHASKGRNNYYRVDARKAMKDAIGGTSFVEYPTLSVVTQADLVENIGKATKPLFNILEPSSAEKSNPHVGAPADEQATNLSAVNSILCDDAVHKTTNTGPSDLTISTASSSNNKLVIEESDLLSEAN